MGYMKAVNALRRDQGSRANLDWLSLFGSLEAAGAGLFTSRPQQAVFFVLAAQDPVRSRLALQHIASILRAIGRTAYLLHTEVLVVHQSYVIPCSEYLGTALYGTS